MAATFSRTLQSLSTDRGRGLLWSILIAAVVLGAWAGWFFGARIGLYVASESARLETVQEAHPVEAPFAGQVVQTHFVVDQSVQVGDLLIELDSTGERLQLAEEQSRLTALLTQLEALRQEIALPEQAITESRLAAGFALDEAHARHEEAKAAEQYARGEAARIRDLRAKGNASESESQLAAAQAAKCAAASEAARAAVARIEKEQRAQEIDRREKLESLLREAKRIEGALETTRATIDRLKHEIERREVRAPVAGRVADVASLPTGSFVKQGDRLGVIVPAGDMKIVAQFAPAKALGRIHEGQTARLRLDGFPWSQFGTISATVTRVAGEVRHGQVQVELAPIADASTRSPLEHGLPGVVEVQVERVSPAASVLRSAGKRFSPQRADTREVER